MDLSGLKWPIIIVVVIGAIWLTTSGGTDFMFKRLIKAEVGQDPDKDRTDEAGLTKLGGFLIKTFQYENAQQVLSSAVSRYPEGESVWYNRYRMVKCAEKLKNYRQAVDILEELMQFQAYTYDSRVPKHDILRLRADKLIELHELRAR